MRITAALAAFALAACTHSPEPAAIMPPSGYGRAAPDTAPAPASQARAAKTLPQTAPHSAPPRSGFQADGQLELRFPQCPERRECTQSVVHAGIRWQYGGTRNIITLFDPFGAEMLTIDYQDASAVVHENGRSTRLSREDIAARTGKLPLPAESLGKWISMRHDTENFSAEGWQVRVLDWQGHYYRHLRADRPPYHVRLTLDNLHPLR